MPRGGMHCHRSCTQNWETWNTTWASPSRLCSMRTYEDCWNLCTMKDSAALVRDKWRGWRRLVLPGCRGYNEAAATPCFPLEESFCCCWCAARSLLDGVPGRRASPHSPTCTCRVALPSLQLATRVVSGAWSWSASTLLAVDALRLGRARAGACPVGDASCAATSSLHCTKDPADSTLAWLLVSSTSPSSGTGRVKAGEYV